MVMRITCWILKTTNTYSQHVLLIASSLQQCLLERASMLLHVIAGRVVKLLQLLKKTSCFWHLKFAVQYPVYKCCKVLIW